MTNESLARSHLRKAQVRLAVLELLHDKGAYSDVVREAQELVELALKALLRQVGIAPARWQRRTAQRPVGRTGQRRRPQTATAARRKDPPPRRRAVCRQTALAPATS